MKHISRFSFYSILLLSFVAGAQEQKTEAVKDSVVPKKERYGLRVGIDIFKPIKSMLDKDYQGIELTADYRYNRNYYIAAELGTENKTTDEDLLNFTTKGSYIKAGFDYNMHENWLNLENMIYVGLRYGFSTYSQELSSYRVYNPDPYFDESPVVQVGRKYNGLTAQWGEVVAGLKTQIFHNTFVGFSFRMNMLFSQKRPEGFDNLYIPGFNRTYDGSFGVGFNYTVSYMLPLYKKSVQAAKDAKKKK